MKRKFRGIRPDDLHGRTALRNPERGFRTEIYFSRIPGEIAGTCSCHAKQLKLDGRSEKPVFQNIDVPGILHLIRGNRLDAVEFSHSQWQDEIDFLAYDGVSVVQSYCFLSRYDDGRQLPQEKLDDIELFFLKLRESRVKALLRFAYELSPSLSGATAATILSHVQQLAPLIRKYSDVIYVLQCGFIGSFGEWHNSFHHLQHDFAFHRELIDMVLEILPQHRRTMLRYPRFKMRLFGTEPLSEKEAFTSLPQARIGHFNDGFLARHPSSGGTFGHEDSIVSAEEEMAYLEAEGKYLPMDGELFWHDIGGVVLPNMAIQYLRRWSYDTLGFVHAHSLFEGEPYSFDIWKRVPIDPLFLFDHQLPVSDGYFTDEQGRHVWRSCYEYIRDHLGYRIELQSADLPGELTAGQTLHAEIQLINRGFSAPVNPRPVRLTLKNGSGGCTFDSPVDLRRWYSGESHSLVLDTVLPADLAPGRYQFGLWMPDADAALENLPEYAIRCANPVEFRDGINLLADCDIR